MRVSVYWNLNKHTFSVRAMEGPNKGRVIEYRDEVFLTDASYVVQPKGRAKVVKEGKKNVHAFVRGRLIEETSGISLTGAVEHITYNPFRDETFVLRTEKRQAIRKSQGVVMVNHGEKPKVMAINPEIEESTRETWQVQ